jgi:hypothetical protein
MARNEWNDEVLPILARSFVALAVVLCIVFTVVLKVRKVKNMVADPTAVRKDNQSAGDEGRPGGSGTFAKPSWPAVKPSSPAVAPPLTPGLRETPPVGGFFAQTNYREDRSDRAILVGFDVGYGKAFDTDVIGYLRPIWLTSSGEQYGTAYGRSQGPITTVKAQSGYAVGGIVIAGGGALEGFCLTFMRIGTKSLIASDAYTSDWYGERTRRPRPELMRKGDGGFVVGFYGKRFDDKGGKNYDDGGAIATIGLVLWVRE